MPSPELVLADHLPEVLDDELARAEGLLGADAPALALGAEALQALDPLVPLDVLVVTLLPARADAGRALGEAHPVGDGGNRNALCRDRKSPPAAFMVAVWPVTPVWTRGSCALQEERFIGSEGLDTH